MERTEPPLVVIVGPTASGKTALAVQLAKEHKGEIICADSRTIYKGMDIGTAKPTEIEQSEVPHWGIDLVLPGTRFTAADFKEYALTKIKEIRARGHVPFLVGGTGLYIDAVLFDYTFGPDRDKEHRKKLEEMDATELQEYCIKNNVPLPENLRNKRHLIRTIERGGNNRQRRSAPISTSVIVGIATDITTLRTRIARRSEQILTNGVVEEAILLGKKYGWQSEAMTGNIYRLVHSHLEDEIDTGKLIDNFTTTDWQLAKRQLTWFRRNPYILWLTQDDVGSYVRSVLVR